MTARTTYSSRVAYFKETTPGTGPADWGASGQLVEHNDFDVSGIKGTWVKDPRAEFKALHTNRRLPIRGIENTDAGKFVAPLTGLGSVTTLNSQAPLTALADLMRHCYGGVSRSNEVAITAVTDATTFEVSAATNLARGQVVWVEDLTDPAPENEGITYPLRILTITDTTIEVEEDAPFTLEVGDRLRATTNIHTDEETLMDLFAAQNTLSWYIQKSRLNGGDLIHQLHGCAANMSISGLSRNGLPSIELGVLASRFLHGGITPVAENGWTNPIQGKAPRVIGRRTIFGMQEYGTTTRQLIDCSSFAPEPGFTMQRVEALTETTYGAQGTWTYSFEPGDPKATVTIGRKSGEFASKLLEGQEYRCYFAQPAPAGACWSIHMPRVTITETPVDAKIGAVHGTTLSLGALVADNAGTSSLAESAIIISLA